MELRRFEFIKKSSSLFFMFSVYFNVASIFVEIAGICDNEVYHYQLNLKESASARRLTRLPSNPKNGVKFRHASYLNFIFCWFVDYPVVIAWWSYLQWDWSVFLHLRKCWGFTARDQFLLSKGLLTLFCRFSCFSFVTWCWLILRLIVSLWLTIVVQQPTTSIYMVFQMIKGRT